MATVPQSDTDSMTLDDGVIGRLGTFSDAFTLTENSTVPHSHVPHSADPFSLIETEYIRKMRSGVWLTPYIGPGETEPFQPPGTPGPYPGLVDPPDDRI
jgi:hypothetical protein